MVSASPQRRYVQVAVPVPLYGLFDYAVPADSRVPEAGCRLQLRFGHRELIGICCGTIDQPATAADKIREYQACLDSEPVIPASLMHLLQRASQYYHHPLGDVLATALPTALMQGRAVDEGGRSLWRLTQQGREEPLEALQRAPKQRAIVAVLRESDGYCDAGSLSARFENWRSSVKALIEKEWLEAISLPPERSAVVRPGPELNEEQRAAVDGVPSEQGFSTTLLRGVTGSGKTEVYFRWIERCLAQGRQALVLVPEIGLTPQLLERFSQRFEANLVVLHSGMTDLERLRSWQLAAAGRAHIVLGTRSALFTPMPALGLIVIDEEHDASFKQQEGFRYHARDLAALRAQAEAIPLILGTATPSFESHHNVRQGRYRELRLSQRAGGARPPIIRMVDARQHRSGSPLSHSLDRAVEQHLAAGNQVMLFLNRRGYAPTLICPQCGWHSDCERCDAHMTLHFQPSVLRCHHCGSEQRPPPHCPSCGHRNLQHQGQGTEQLTMFLEERFPEATISRIDRDSTRRKGSLEAELKKVQRGEVDMLVGTQMLAKGHHFPSVTLVGVLDCDRGLFSADFKATEHMAQLILQVAGRAGRADKPGEVLIQSTQPDHPLMHCLITQGYEAFTQQALKERQVLGLPPFGFAALLRAESVEREAAMRFLQSLCPASPDGDVQWLGPIPSPMERRAGRYRAQLLLLSQNRKALHVVLAGLVHTIQQQGSIKNVRWSLDVDPTNTL
ncbi:primosomal protein N' [gamma proteobacterium HTCC5015]|nr:primosomal protein N' [gamma proteobacterium HTCC5015]